MSYRKCQACKGIGVLHGTPPLIVPQQSNQVDKLNDNVSQREGSTSYGLEVTCWRCLGKGQVWDGGDMGAGGSNG